jgi:hypothetical protein
VWTVIMIGALVGLVQVGPSVWSSMAVFGGTAAIAALFGLALCRIRPRFSLILPWLREHQQLGARYLIENVAVGGSRQIRFIAVGAAAGLTAVGTVRAAELLMGPFLIVLMGIAQVAVPEASAVVKRAPHRLPAFALTIGGVQAGLAALWGIAMAIALPLGAGQLLLRDLWHSAYPLLLPATLVVVLSCICQGATTALRALGAAPRSLVAQLTASSLYVIGGVAGAFINGASGSAWGYAMGTVIAVGVWWYQLRRAVAEHLVTWTPVPADPEPLLTPGAIA